MMRSGDGSKKPPSFIEDEPSNRRDLSRRPVQSRTDPWRRLIVPDLIRAIHDLDPLHRAPAGHKGAGNRRFEEIDGQCVVHDTSRTRWG
jgi:hypothetical protein